MDGNIRPLRDGLNQPARQSKGSQKRAETVEKQRAVLEARIRGATFEQIAKHVGYKDASGAWRAMQAALKATIQEPADTLRRVELERLDWLWRSLGPDITKGKPRSIEVALRVLDRRAQLLGLDAPRKVDVSLETIAAHVAAEAGLSVEEVLAEAERVLAEMSHRG